MLEMKVPICRGNFDVRHGESHFETRLTVKAEAVYGNEFLAGIVKGVQRIYHSNVSVNLFLVENLTLRRATAFVVEP
jgi:hypothetical protein